MEFSGFFFCFVCRPVVITDVVRNWKAMNWTKSFLVSNYGDKRVSMKATEVRWFIKLALSVCNV